MQVNSPHKEQSISDTTAIFDEITMVSKNKLGPAIYNFRQRSEAFLETVLCVAIDIFKIHVVFNRYFESFLIERKHARKKMWLRIRGNSVWGSRQYPFKENPFNGKFFISHKNRTKINNISWFNPLTTRGKRFSLQHSNYV